jgi:hypothetical protein
MPNASSKTCPRCRRETSGDGERCIFCWASLTSKPMRWRNVYHAVNSIDAWLAKSALESHGVCVRIKDEHASRMMLHGHTNMVVEAAEGDHWLAQEVLRQVRGVRTDTEYLEWQELKRRRSPLRKLVIGALAVVAAAAAATLTGTLLTHTTPGSKSGSAPTSAPAGRPGE